LMRLLAQGHARETAMQNALKSLSDVYVPRQGEIARLELLLSEARRELQTLARKGESDADQRVNVNELMKDIARLKVISRIHR
jgi:hypothetical protein